MTGKQPGNGSKAGNGAADDIKAKMRAALEKKQKHDQEHLTAEGAHNDGSERMHPIAGHVDTQTYRRKAGGGGS